MYILPCAGILRKSPGTFSSSDSEEEEDVSSISTISIVCSLPGGAKVLSSSCYTATYSEVGGSARGSDIPKDMSKFEAYEELEDW